MNKRALLILLMFLVVLLTGWIYYVSSQVKQPEPVEKISVKWWDSAHADITAEAFVHWNEDEPSEVPVNCAKCHSGQGFLDYIGQDGSQSMYVDEPAAIESVISCEVCHNESSTSLETVIFPSGNEIILKSSDAICATCHSGMSAGSQVDSVSTGYADDEIIPDSSFINPHYAFAAATWAGSKGSGGYQYPTKEYSGQFTHAVGVQTCTQCHDPHSLHIEQDYENADLCSTCHSEVSNYKDYRNVNESGVDYDGNGEIEGLYYEIEGVRSILFEAVQQYTQEILAVGIGWADQYPYLFVDTDMDGDLSADEMAFPNAFSTFTPRLMRTMFNYQFSIKDPAGYVHNGTYILQLLYDSIEDISGVMPISFDLSTRPE